MPEPRLKGNVSVQRSDGVQERRQDAGVVKVDVDLIPDHVAEELAAVTLECVRNFLKKSGGREYLDDKIARDKAGY